MKVRAWMCVCVCRSVCLCMSMRAYFRVQASAFAFMRETYERTDLPWLAVTVAVLLETQLPD